MGFQPPTCGRPRRVARQQFPGRRLFCVRPGTPGGGLCPAEVRGYGRPLSTTEALEHTASILGGLPALHRRVVRQERRGVIRPRVQGRPTTAPAPAPFWLRCSTSQYPTDQVNTNESQTMHCEASHHQVRGRTAVRARQGRKRAPRADVARRAGRVGGNQPGQRIAHAKARVGFLPRLKTRVSALQYL